MRPSVLVSAPLAIVLALACAATACRPGSLDDIAFDRREALPGFDIALPRGKIVRERRATAAGEVLVQVRSAVAGVTWQAGRVRREDVGTFARTAMDALATAIGSKGADEVPLTLAAPDYGVELVALTDKHVYMVLSLVQCDHANVTVHLITMASNDRARALRFHARLRATLRCRQDGPPVGVAAGLPAFALADDIAYLPGSDPPSYYALTGERWYVTPGTRSGMSAFERPDVVARMFTGLGLTVTHQERLTASSPAWLQLRLAVEIAGEKGEVLMGGLGCADESAFTVIYMNPLAFATPLDPEGLERVACPTAPVDASTLPAVQARFGAACDGGDAQACALLLGLLDEEPALLQDVDAATVKTRACALGVPDTCP